MLPCHAPFAPLAAKLPARRVPEAVERLVALYAAERDAGETAASFFRRVDVGVVKAALADLEPVWAELFPKEQARVLELLVQEVRVNVPQGRMEIDFRPGGPKAVAGGARR